MMNQQSSTATPPKQRRDEFLQAISRDLLSKSNQSPHSLADAVRRCINSKCEWNLPTPEFIIEIRTKLYVIHKYNCQILQDKGKYPKSRQLDLLLVRYVELEYEVLYSKCNVSKIWEKLVAQRVLRLLWIVLSKAFGTTDNVKMKNSVLKLLANVRSDYLGQDKFLGGIAGQLLGGLKKAKYGNDLASYLKKSVRSDSEKCLTTSDYGSDSDGDSRDFSSWSNSPVAKNEADEVANNASNKSDNQFYKTSCFDKSTICKKEIESDVIICPDSEDEEIQTKNIVTFEIIDDDDDDDDDDKDSLNYMVYLQKDTVKSKKEKCIKQKVCDKVKVEESIIICSDSEDEEKSELNVAIVDNPVKLEATDASDATFENLMRNEGETHAALDDILKFYHVGDEEATPTIKSEESDGHVNETEVRVKTEDLSNAETDTYFSKAKTNEEAGVGAGIPAAETLSDIALSTEITINPDTFLNPFQLESDWLPPFLTNNLDLTNLNNLSMSPAMQYFENEDNFDDNQTIGGPLLSDNSKRPMISSFDTLFDDNVPEANGFFDFFSFNNDNDITFGDISRVENDIDGIEQLNNFIQTELGIKSPAASNKRISQVSSDCSSKKLRLEEKCEINPISLSLDKRNAS